MKWLPQQLDGKESTCSSGATGDAGSVSVLERFPGGGHGNPLWRILQTEDPGRLESIGSQRVLGSWYEDEYDQGQCKSWSQRKQEVHLNWDFIYFKGLRDRATVTRMQDGDSTTLTFCPCLALSIIFFLLPFWGGKCNYITLYFNLQKSEIC